ncbi:GntR family transcriptional regulator [Brachybacterium muris]|uniref:GntR family transcriptional regulator n=1 Tax=Brachybacterium muris TaxID=219301 RepID=UPI00223B72E5|nr:GntR family transcriptional regulator [Brachybacterium muris]MCT2177079.1 GntR family transcriptional regulator [Brachybacterium muris]
MHIPIDPAASEPIYEQIRTGIAEAIVSGRLAPGEALPSIRSLARDLRVSVITTTRAYNELVSDGLVVPQQGRGVFVRDQPTGALQERARTRISEALDEATRTARIGVCQGD